MEHSCRSHLLMMERGDFAEKVKVLYGQPIEELIRIEFAVGVKSVR
jgi:hypothetical protein